MVPNFAFFFLPSIIGHALSLHLNARNIEASGL
jgi:hypothetical protein